MTTLALVHSVGSVGAFANRAFLPAFLTAAFLRFGPEYNWLAWIPLLEQVRDTPTWFTHDITLWVLGVLSLLEILLAKSAEWRELTASSQEWTQTALALLTTLGIISAADAEFAAAAVPVAAAGIGEWGLPLIAAAGTLVLGTLVGRVERSLIAVDPDDAFQLGRWLSWGRDLSAFGLIFAALLIPLLAIFLVLLMFAALAVLTLWMKRAEERRRHPCASCGQSIHAAARLCPHCGAEQAEVFGLNWLGFTTARRAGTEHDFQLLSVDRCPHCAEALERNRLPALCGTCDRQSLGTRAELDHYLDQVQRRVPGVALVALLCSFLPALGFALSFLVNRLALVRPLRVHTPLGQRLLARIGLRVLTVVALLIHWVPLLGQFVLPLLSWASWRVHRQALLATAPKLAGTAPEQDLLDSAGTA